jgi:putative transcriptional regulator
MMIQHHPDDLTLSAFSAGTLDLGLHVAIATHLAACAHCRGWTRSMEQVGGAVLMSLPPAAMASDALARVQARLVDARLDEQRNPVRIETAAPSSDVAIAGLPKFVQRYPFGDWQWVAPRVHLRPIELPRPAHTRVFLLKSAPGTKMLAHSHTGTEMTCVLSGAFRHDGGRFGPGDFDLGDEAVEHRVTVEGEDDCICLIAMHGELKLSGLLGRLMQPFVRL